MQCCVVGKKSNYTEKGFTRKMTRRAQWNRQWSEEDQWDTDKWFSNQTIIRKLFHKRFTKLENKDIEWYLKLYIQRHETPSLLDCEAFLSIYPELVKTNLLYKYQVHSINTCATCLATTSRLVNPKMCLVTRLDSRQGMPLLSFIQHLHDKRLVTKLWLHLTDNCMFSIEF